VKTVVQTQDYQEISNTQSSLLMQYQIQTDSLRAEIARQDYLIAERQKAIVSNLLLIEELQAQTNKVKVIYETKYKDYSDAIIVSDDSICWYIATVLNGGE
jgi:hypothetical protein